MNEIVISDDGRWMSTYSRQRDATDRGVRVWDLAADDPGRSSAVFTVFGNKGNDLYSPDGRLIFSDTDEGRRLWDFGSGPTPFSALATTLDGTPVALGPADSQGFRWLITVRKEDSSALLWRIEPDNAHRGSWIVQRQLDPLPKAERFSVTPDHTWMALGGADGTVFVANMRDRTSAWRRFRGGGSRVESLELGRGWLSLVQGNSLHLWNLVQHHGSADPVVLRSGYGLVSGNRLIAGLDNGLGIWDLSTPALGEPVTADAGRGVQPIAASRNGDSW